MKTKNAFVTIILVIIFIIFMIFLAKLNKKEDFSSICGKYEKKEIIIGEKTVKADISDNDCKRQLGLSGRESLGNDEGMFFVFDKIGSYGFWMKDMKFPIDILWINEELTLIGIEKNVQPSTYPQSFGANYIAKYVIELPALFSDKNNLKIGDKIIFSSK